MKVARDSTVALDRHHGVHVHLAVDDLSRPAHLCRKVVAGNYVLRSVVGRHRGYREGVNGSDQRDDGPGLNAELLHLMIQGGDKFSVPDFKRDHALSVPTSGLSSETVWKPALVKAGVIPAPARDRRGRSRYVTTRKEGVHQLRHYYASVMLAGDVSIKELAEYLGHSDPAFTLRVDAHMLPSSHDRAHVVINDHFAALMITEQ